MHKLVVPVEIARLLKSLNFNEECVGFYKNDNYWIRLKCKNSNINNVDNNKLLKYTKSENCTAPTYLQALTFFDSINIFINTNYDDNLNWSYSVKSDKLFLNFNSAPIYSNRINAINEAFSYILNNINF